MAAFGYGKKSDFTRGPNFPAPNVYEKVSFITKNREKRRGKTFGVSRKVRFNYRFDLGSAQLTSAHFSFQ